MRTEIKLNDVYYKVLRLPTQTLANQMASKVGQGQSNYGDLTTWSAWIQESWQEGVGKLRPHRQGGFLYGEADSRVPEQLILPGLVRQVDTRDLDGTRADCRYMAVDVTATLTVGTGQTNTRVAMPLTTPATVTGSTFKVWMYVRASVGTVLNFAIYSESSSVPNASVTADTLTVLEDTEGFSWLGIDLPYNGTLSAATAYWLVVWPSSGTIEVARGGTTTFATNARGLQTGPTWGDLGYAILYSTSAHKLEGQASTNNGTGFFRFSDEFGASSLYHYMRGRLFTYDDTNDQWDAVTYISGDGTDGDIEIGVNSAVVFPKNALDGSFVFFGTEVGTTAYTLESDGTWDQLVWIDDGPSIYGNLLFAKWAGYLYLGHGNKIYYFSPTYDTSPVSTDEMTVGSYEYPVTGMCGMGDSMYVSTAEGLYRIAPGDFGVGVCPWDSPQEDNGCTMVNYQGALYITANNRVLRLTEDHQMQDVWLTREEDLAAGRIGKVWDLCVWDKWLLALCASTTVGSNPTIWAMQDNAWHHIATLPAGESQATDTLRNYSLYYDRITDNIFCCTPDQLTYRIATPQFATNPYNDGSYRYMPYAWVEWDWFDSPVMEADKDYESITIIGENISSSTPVYLYWKDDDSTAWESLGTVTSSGQEVRWTVAMGTRPDTKRFKLGILLHSNSGSATPRVRAIRVKYHLMVRDWWRWSLVLDVSGRNTGYQLLADGTRNNLTYAQIKTNLMALAAARTPPFIYQDVDGLQYEVKVNDGNFQYTKYEYNDNTLDEWWEAVCNLVIEQVTQDAYTPP